MSLIKARWIVINEDRIFLQKDAKKWFFYLPGWTHESDETIGECLIREIKEETWVEGKVSHLALIRELRNSDGIHTLDFWYVIENSDNFLSINIQNATHAFEHSDFGFYEISKLWEIDVRPANLAEILGDLKKKEVIFSAL